MLRKCVIAAIAFFTARAQAQHPSHHGDSSSTISSPTREGSGTAWIPDASPMRGRHRAVGAWDVMLDGNAFVQYVQQFGTREHWQFGSTNWLMVMAARDLGGSDLQLRAMFSAEPATVGRIGYPLLLQTAQPYRDGMLTDRQHPHELISEIAIRYRRKIDHRFAAEIYLAPAGEPALGPVAYRHRPSAVNDPVAPLGHHAQDITHTSFGVATLGVFTSVAKLELSAFNGRHADDRRTNLDLGDARLDSYSARLTINPAPNWSLSGSIGKVRGESSEHGFVHGNVQRTSASVLHTRDLRAGTRWSSAFVYGENLADDTNTPLGTMLIETNLDIGRASVFLRAERLRRSADELALTGSIAESVQLSSYSVGAAYSLATFGGILARSGGRLTVNHIPSELEPFYGSRTPHAVLLYIALRPSALR